jgi:hypothetical protein
MATEMTIIKYRDWEFSVDKTLTKQTYDKIQVGGPESCGCNDCKNFANNRDKIYPDEIKQLLADLGVDYRKENEICHYCKLDNGFHFYGGWFHFRGTFIGQNCSTKLESGGSTIELTPITESFSLGFHFSNSLAFFEDTTNLVQIEFDAKTPWTIDKELESE